MESNKTNKNIVIDDNIIKAIFDKSEKPVNKVIDNKYFDLSKCSIQSAELASKKDPKTSMDMREWFIHLSLEERILAISTIFSRKGREILDEIRNDLTQLIRNDFKDPESNKYFHQNTFYPTYSTFNSNEEILMNGGTSVNRYASLNAKVRQGSNLSKHITFLDTITTEDTLSLTEEILQNPEVFLDIMEECK